MIRPIVRQTRPRTPSAARSSPRRAGYKADAGEETHAPAALCAFAFSARPLHRREINELHCNGDCSHGRRESATPRTPSLLSAIRGGASHACLLVNFNVHAINLTLDLRLRVGGGGARGKKERGEKKRGKEGVLSHVMTTTT